MRSSLAGVLIAIVLAACKGEGDDRGASDEGSVGAESTERENGQTGGEDAIVPTSVPTTRETGQSFAGRRGGRFESERFNVRFQLPTSWHLTSSQTEDSLTFEGAGGIRMVVASSESIQLVDGNFSNLNNRVSFEAVNLLPDRTQAGPVNGLPGYRVEGDALLRGEDLPIYFLSQAVSLPGQPVMVTVFVPGDSYFEHSETMTAVLDSIEALDLRPH